MVVAEAWTAKCGIAIEKARQAAANEVKGVCFRAMLSYGRMLVTPIELDPHTCFSGQVKLCER